jgi:hypothetical protein
VSQEVESPEVKEYSYSTDPHPFIVNGQKFEARSGVSIKRLGELQRRLTSVQEMQGDDDVEIEEVVERVKEFFGDVLLESSVEPFVALIDHDDNPLPVNILGQIMLDLMHHYGNVEGLGDDVDPTPSVSGSSSGQKKTGSGSKGARSSRGSTSKKTTRANASP